MTLISNDLSEVTKFRMECESTAQNVLPIRMECLGIRLQKDIPLPVFNSSLYSVCSLDECSLQNVRRDDELDLNLNQSER